MLPPKAEEAARGHDTGTQPWYGHLLDRGLGSAAALRGTRPALGGSVTAVTVSRWLSLAISASQASYS